MNFIDKTMILVVVGLLTFIALSVGFNHLLEPTTYPEISLLDLYGTTWDKNSGEIVGKYNGSIIRRNQFEVWTWDDKDKEIKWCDYYGETVVLINKFQNWKITVENNKYYDLSRAGGVLRILNEDKNVIVTIK